jgi:hypothetical protein
MVRVEAHSCLPRIHLFCAALFAQIRSDFLAVNVAARVTISKLIDSDDDFDDADSSDASSSPSAHARPGERSPASASAMRVVFDRTVATLSAVQYSYVTPLRPLNRHQSTVREGANEKLKGEL